MSDKLKLNKRGFVNFFGINIFLTVYISALFLKII